MNSINNNIYNDPINNQNNSNNSNNNLININNNLNVYNKSKRFKLSCRICNKKLPIFVIKCKCNKSYCSIHRYPDEHDCEYDYKIEFQKELTLKNKKIKVIKVEKI